MASAAAEEKTESASSTASVAAPSGGGGSKLVLILTAVNLIVTVAMVAILFISFQRDRKKARVDDIVANDGAAQADNAKSGEGGESAKAGEGANGAAKDADEFGKMVTLDQFTVNLSTPGSASPKFVRVNISLEVPNDDLEQEVNAKIPEIRNVIIDLFNSKRASDLATADGRDYLKEEIKNALNSFLVHGKIRGVYFTNFALAG